ncbi:hypothetical protein BH23ACT6_BH23ACT6_12600 [soil metagenome]
MSDGSGRHRRHAAPWSSRREYRCVATGRRAERAHQRHLEWADFARRLVPGVVVATVLLGAGQLLTPQRSVESADADTGAINAMSAVVLPTDVSPEAVTPIRSAPPASRSAIRPSLNTIDASGVGQQLAAFQVAAAMTSTKQASTDVEQSVRDEAQKLAFVAPIEGARVTSGYGQRWGRMHHGMDFGADVGHPLYAMSDATVTTASYNSGLGHHVRITLADGTEVSYGHLSKISVLDGEVVQPGTLIGKVGSSGSSTGAHLHLEVRDPRGERVDPKPWLAKRGLL